MTPQFRKAHWFIPFTK